MVFTPLRTHLPSSLPGCLVAPGLEEAGVLGRRPALVSLKQTGGKEPAHHSSRLCLGAVAGQEGGTTALGTQQGHPKNASHHPGSPPSPSFGSHPYRGCCNPCLRAWWRGYLLHSTYAPGHGITGECPSQQIPDPFSHVHVFMTP